VVALFGSFYAGQTQQQLVNQLEVNFDHVAPMVVGRVDAQHQVRSVGSDWARLGRHMCRCAYAATTQHSTAQHSTAQHSTAHGNCLCVCVMHSLPCDNHPPARPPGLCRWPRRCWNMWQKGSTRPLHHPATGKRGSEPPPRNGRPPCAIC
jgi:hypothetical protein